MDHFNEAFQNAMANSLNQSTDEQLIKFNIKYEAMKHEAVYKI